MQPTLCSRCNQNLAVIFITKMENNQSVSEGLCLKCANELGLKPVQDLMEKMGITEEDLESMNTEMMGMFQEMEGMDLPMMSDDTDEDAEGQTATFPFLNKLFGGPMAQPPKIIPIASSNITNYLLIILFNIFITNSVTLLLPFSFPNGPFSFPPVCACVPRIRSGGSRPPRTSWSGWRR